MKKNLIDSNRDTGLFDQRCWAFTQRRGAESCCGPYVFARFVGSNDPNGNHRSALEMRSLEMQHFRKAGVIEVTNIVRPGDSSKQYILVEAYHPSETLDLKDVDRINAEVKQVLYDENLLV